MTSCPAKLQTPSNRVIIIIIFLILTDLLKNNPLNSASAAVSTVRAVYFDVYYPLNFGMFHADVSIHLH